MTEKEKMLEQYKEAYLEAVQEEEREQGVACGDPCAERVSTPKKKRKPHRKVQTVLSIMVVLAALTTILVAGLAEANHRAATTIQDIDAEPNLSFEVGWIPDGFVITEEDAFPDCHWIFFEKQTENGDYASIFIEKLLPFEIYIDTENAEIKEIKIHGYDATLIIKHNMTRVIWLNTDENCVYYADAENMPVKTFLRVVKSIS